MVGHQFLELSMFVRIEPGEPDLSDSLPKSPLPPFLGVLGPRLVHSAPLKEGDHPLTLPLLLAAIY